MGSFNYVFLLKLKIQAEASEVKLVNKRDSESISLRSSLQGRGELDSSGPYRQEVGFPESRAIDLVVSSASTD